MGQAANKRRESAQEAKAMTKYIASSPRKLNLVAQMIRGKSAAKAMTDLAFCERRVANEVRKTLQSAIANAENNHNLDVDRLVVSEAVVGKSVMMRRFRARARGRVGPVEKFFSRITIIVREKEV